MVKEGARDERAIDGRHKSQRAYTRPFPFCSEPESSNAITENDGPNEPIQQGRDARGPEWKMQFGQKEKAQTHNQVNNSYQQCEYALCRAKSEMIHGTLLPCSSGNATIIQQMGKKRITIHSLLCQKWVILRTTFGLSVIYTFVTIAYNFKESVIRHTMQGDRQ